MSEPNNTFPFPGMEDSEELDVASIFGGGGPASDVNPISAAIDKQETKTAQAAAKSLFEKLPIFSYGSAKDEITDGAMTFEELRIAKSDDFPELGEGKASDKAICLFPSGDGRVYGLRKTELGEFVAPKDNVVEFPSVRAGFTPALPLIPASLLNRIVSFFRCYMNETAEFETLVHILWDKELEQFVVHVPPQEVSKAHINADLSRDEYPEERYLHYMDIHSHNSMAAKFSPVDDQDERATRLYAVVGRPDRFFPEITVRMSCGGTYCELDPALVFESLGETFPRDWRNNVKIGETQAKKDAKIRLREILDPESFWGGRS